MCVLKNNRLFRHTNIGRNSIEITNEIKVGEIFFGLGRSEQ